MTRETAAPNGNGEGPGADKMAVSGSDAFRVFDVVNQGLTVTIAGLTITHGRGSGGLTDLCRIRQGQEGGFL